MENAAKKRKRHDSTALRENGITYRYNDRYRVIAGDEKERLYTDFPQAALVAEGLLDFEKILSTSSYERLSEKNKRRVDKCYRHSKIPSQNKRSSLDIESYEEKYQISVHDARFELARRISRSARDIQSEKEPRWSTVIKNELFGNLIQSSRRAEGLRVLGPEQIIDRVKVEDEDQWTQGQKALYRTTPSTAPLLTAPRPDLYIALPIIKRNSNARGFHKDDHIQNFTENCLAALELAKNGNLISNPITQLDKVKGLKEKDFICFPCAVVEIKHHDVRKSLMEDCYCQAANAAAAALSMLGRLSHLSIPDMFFGEIQPVVAFTFIGYRSRVWIAYISDKRFEDERYQCEYEMVCIWRGDLRDVWDSVRLCRIIEHLHYWTVRHFRPWVSSCIDRWRWVIRADDAGDGCYMGDIEDLRWEVREDDLDLEEDSEEEAEAEDEEEEEEEEEEEAEAEGDSTDEDGDDAESEDEGGGASSSQNISRQLQSLLKTLRLAEKTVVLKSSQSTPQRRRNNAGLSP